MDEYDALVTSERIKNIFVEYLFSKDKLNTFYKCNKAHAGQGLVAYMNYSCYSCNGTP